MIPKQIQRQSHVLETRCPSHLFTGTCCQDNRPVLEQKGEKERTEDMGYIFGDFVENESLGGLILCSHLVGVDICQMDHI